jgi:outer membrane autotransporter protein
MASEGQPTAVAARDDALPGRMALGAGSDGARAPAPVGGPVFWAQGYGTWGDFDGDGNAADVSRTLGGFVTGVDAALGGGWRIGIATGYSHTNLDVSSRLSSAEIDSYHLAAYAGGWLGRFMLRTGASWTWHDIDTERAIVFPGVVSNADASYDGETGQVFGEVALPLGTGAVAIEPFAGLAWVHVGTDGFAESGGLGALTARSGEDDTAYASLGLRASTEIRADGVTLIPRLAVAWQHAFDDVTPAQGVSLAPGGPELSISGAPIARNSALIEAGVGFALTPDATLGISYQGQIADDAQDHGVSGRVDWRF